MSAVLAFAYILPIQIVIGSVVFFFQEFDDVVFSVNGANYVVLNYQLTLFGWIGYAVAIAAVSAFQYARKFDDVTES